MNIEEIITKLKNTDRVADEPITRVQAQDGVIPENNIVPRLTIGNVLLIARLISKISEM